ncbi:TPA: SecY-interacting protein [Photobacterium damselae]
MNHPVSRALSDFSSRFLQTWCDADLGLPKSEDLIGLDSPCVVEENLHWVSWKPVQHQTIQPLSAVERGIELRLHEDIVAFYGSQFSGDMSACFGELELDLLQVFCESDAKRLQENILGHLVTQRRLKLKPTVFIATVEDESKVISICNLTGQVVLETLGKLDHQVLAADVEHFLTQLQPIVREV